MSTRRTYTVKCPRHLILYIITSITSQWKASCWCGRECESNWADGVGGSVGVIELSFDLFGCWYRIILTVTHIYLWIWDNVCVSCQSEFCNTLRGLMTFILNVFNGMYYCINEMN